MIPTTTDQRGALQRLEKELNDAMSERESRKTTWQNEVLDLEHQKVLYQTETHSRPRVRLLSKGAETKYDQKQMLKERKNQEILQLKVRQVTSAIKDGRESYSTSMYDPITHAILATSQIESRTSMNTEEKLGGATQQSMLHCKGVLDHISLQYQYSLQLTSRARKEFSDFLTVFEFRKVFTWCLHS